MPCLGVIEHGRRGVFLLVELEGSGGGFVLRGE